MSGAVPGPDHTVYLCPIAHVFFLLWRILIQARPNNVAVTVDMVISVKDLPKHFVTVALVVNAARFTCRREVDVLGRISTLDQPNGDAVISHRAKIFAHCPLLQYPVVHRGGHWAGQCERNAPFLRLRRPGLVIDPFARLSRELSRWRERAIRSERSLTIII